MNPRDDDTQDRDISRSDALEMLSESESPTPERRSFLKGAAATGLATLGFTSTAAAIDPTGTVELKATHARYESQDAVRAAFETHAGELLGLLAQRGHLDGSVEELLGKEVSTNATRVGDTATGHVEATTQLDDGELSVVVQPEIGRSYAVKRADGTTTLLEPETEDGVTTLSEATPQSKMRCVESITCSYCEDAEVSCNSGCTVLSFSGDCCTGCEGCGC